MLNRYWNDLTVGQQKRRIALTIETIIYSMIMLYLWISEYEYAVDPTVMVSISVFYIGVVSIVNAGLIDKYGI